MISPADLWTRLAALPRPTLRELFSATRDGGEGTDEPGDADRVAMLSGRIELGSGTEGAEDESAILDAGGIFFDWSKTHLDRAVLAGFEELAEAMDFAGMRAKLFAGEVVNPTENRAADHATLRGVGDPAKVEEAEALLERMALLVEAIHQGALGDVDHLIHIGIGGSALGPALGVDALSRELSYCDVHVVSNIDGVALEAAFAACDPAKTLIAVASKTFTTIETMTNAASALKWLSDNGVADPYGRVVALTASPEKAVEWGMDETRILPFPESVGGRYSVWSSIGFPVAMAAGMEDFRAFLAGAKAMDEHFRDTDGSANLVLRAAFADLYYTRIRGCQTRAVFAYDERLGLFPDYLQQLEMESNGKRVTAEMQPVDGATAPVTWGGVGTDAQHAVFQLLHQGTHLIPVDFIASVAPGDALDPAHHRILLTNCFAQAAALMAGDKGEDPARHSPGDRPSATILADDFDAATLGALIAFHEHRVFAGAVLMGINPFDQFGVELGKQMAKAIEKGGGSFDASTTGLLERAGLG
ncbi:glucose-6-phosphate isomerase [Qipengyuania sp. DY56-A-20]|uniref:Glucose-6-phosphate isomerase n=1 Tax=Qipengyuania benthica TaxID=3067651 RepID=A0ABT9H8V6_9SPHN|nr:glucose-6-phosphate isomerase [Qipengyuania sp. DY56-A-20]MDP4539759.1 glucose-6-phosphate isomerase [Qipengyuania sp. DY56-A-20]